MRDVSGKADLPDTGRARVLLALKTKGPSTAARLARRLGITSMAVHQHLASLQDEGLVAFTKERGKVGRPAHLWELTPRAHSRFRDGHAELTAGILQAVHATFGDEGLEQIAQQWTRQQVTAYREVMPAPDAPIERRIAALTEIRGDEGFMAEWGRRCDGSIEFVEHHCAIARAARLCPHLCDGELALFRTVLGADVRVERVEHALQGDTRCAYQIVGADQDGDSPPPSKKPG